jgi:DNA-binding NarL/FixJ family response regulator
MIRILLADDYTIIRKGVRQILSQAYPHVEIEEIEEGEEWTEKLYASSWDMVISDLPMPDRGGLDTLQRIHQHLPGLPVLILTLYPKKNYAVRALKAGAAGFLSKDAAANELITAVDMILSGKKYIALPGMEN